jgi:hypothetical protein
MKQALQIIACLIGSLCANYQALRTPAGSFPEGNGERKPLHSIQTGLSQRASGGSLRLRFLNGFLIMPRQLKKGSFTIVNLSQVLNSDSIAPLCDAY